MTKWNPSKEELHMYRLPGEPPKEAAHDYIVEYKRTGEAHNLAAFLHVLEQKTLNGWVYRLCDKYGQPGRFQDIKQEMVRVLLEKLDGYDSALGTTLVQFARRDMLAAVHEYMRKNVGIFLLSDKYYANLRKVSAIYYRGGELPYEARIRAIMTEAKMTRKQVETYIIAGKGFRYPGQIESNIVDFSQAKLAPDLYCDPADIVPRAMFYDALVERIEALRVRDRELLLDYLGIICLHCGRAGAIPPLAGIADKLQLRDEQSVTAGYRRIVGELREGLEQGM